MSLGDDLRARIDAAGKKVERIETKGPLGVVFMRRVSGHMRTIIEELKEKVPPHSDGKHYLPPRVVVAFAICDDDGDPLWEFDDAVARIGKLDEEHQNELFAHALRITGLGARAVEDAEKKSSSSQSDESGTTSPPSSEAAP